MAAISIRKSHSKWERRPLHKFFQTRSARTKAGDQAPDVEALRSTRRERRLNRAQALQHQLAE